MEFYDVLRTRRSVRAYKDTPVPDEVLERILEAGSIAPSWCNRQCWRFVVVRDPAVKKMLGEVVNNPSAACYENAPVAIAVCADPSDSSVTGGKEYYLVDCAVAMEHIMLAAVSEGLAACWVGAFAEYPVRNVLKLPGEIKIVAITPLGYADEEPAPTPRRPLAETVHWNEWRRGG